MAHCYKLAANIALSLALKILPTVVIVAIFPGLPANGLIASKIVSISQSFPKTFQETISIFGKRFRKQRAVGIYLEAQNFIIADISLQFALELQDNLQTVHSIGK